MIKLFDNSDTGRLHWFKVFGKTYTVGPGRLETEAAKQAGVFEQLPRRWWPRSITHETSRPSAADSVELKKLGVHFKDGRAFVPTFRLSEPKLGSGQVEAQSSKMSAKAPQYALSRPSTAPTDECERPATADSVAPGS